MITESLMSLIKSEPKTNAAKEARKLGLKYMGFGRYAGRNGKIAYLVDQKKDRLVPYAKPDEIDQMQFDMNAAKADYHESGQWDEPVKGDAKEKEKIRKKNAASREKFKKQFMQFKTKFDDTTEALKTTGKENRKQLFFKEKQVERAHKTLSSLYRPAIFSEDEIKAIGWYTISGASEINKFIYSGYEPGVDSVAGMNHLHKSIADLDSAFDETETPIPITVYSGLSDRYDASNLQKGKKFIFRGYVSTSLKWEVAIEFARATRSKGKDAQILLQIEIPANSKGIYVDSLSAGDGEQEFLLPRGSMIEVIESPHNINQDLLFGAQIEVDETEIQVIHCRLIQEEE